MNNKFHGVFSKILIFFSIVIGLLFIMNKSIPMGLLYLAIIFISTVIIVYSFCSKCTCRLDSCDYIFPGKLSKLLPSRKQNNYTMLDILGAAVPLTVLIIFPQFWLWENKIFLIIFWLFLFIALVEFMLFICKNCNNEKCPGYIKK